MVIQEISENSGVYKITNLINSKIYIGSSKDLKDRSKKHLNMLKKIAITALYYKEVLINMVA